MAVSLAMFFLPQSPYSIKLLIIVLQRPRHHGPGPLELRYRDHYVDSSIGSWEMDSKVRPCRQEDIRRSWK
jgi:hypothetical protein